MDNRGTYDLWFLPNLRSFIQIVAPVLPNEPSYPSIAAKYPVANWFERETFDLFGIRFRNHPDLRRIMLPDNWVGHPLRKDYRVTGDRV